ncbi:hypothetical protein P7C73_g2909, partial [Tremellales sp. Uapishka_1]
MSEQTTTESEEQAPAPSQINGQLTAAQGLVYSAIGSVIPEALGSSSYLASGAELQETGQKEVDAAKRKQAIEATVDSASGKLKSGVGYLTGNQERQTQGNLEAEKAQWSYKQAMSDGVAAVPVPSAEGVKGKLQSVKGMVTGDMGEQMKGNERAEKAAWADGV